MKKKVCVGIFWILTVLNAAFGEHKSVYDWAFIKLDYVKTGKVRQLQRFCDNIHCQAEGACKDELMLDFFYAALNFNKYKKSGEVPEKFARDFEKFEKIVRQHYINQYISFYDILFISDTGDIFYTIRKERDFGKNVFEGQLGNGPLAEVLRANPTSERFVDFHYYPSSEEPAAFFVEPAVRKGEMMGWFVMQAAVNKINSLFAGFDELGATGETFLVNNDGFMLSESNFVGDSTILKVRLDDKNIVPKFEQRTGRRYVKDYRGYRAISSFEVYDFLGCQWLVVAKVDLAQVVTEHFMQHPKFYYDSLAEHISKDSECPDAGELSIDEEQAVMVDMDEYIKASHGEVLRTVGVSSCTAVIATYPGKFGYLAHLSPYDEMYGRDSTNLLGNIIKKVNFYDIYKYQRRGVRFVVAANHLNSLEKIIEKITGEGFLLSQIYFLHNPHARTADVVFDYSQNDVFVRWNLGGAAGGEVIESACEQNNLGVLMESFIEK